MKLQFTKMHGAGNDFIVIDSTEAPFTMIRITLLQMIRS